MAIGLVVLASGNAGASNWVIADTGGSTAVLLSDGAVSAVADSPYFSGSIFGGGPHNVAVSNALGLAYATLIGPNVPPAGTVPIVIIDMALGMVTGLVGDPLGIARPWGGSRNRVALATSPDGETIYYISTGELFEIPEFGSIDAMTNTVIAAFDLPLNGLPPQLIELSPDGTTAYVTGNKELFVIDVGAMSLTATVSLPSQPDFADHTAAFRISNDGAKLYMLTNDWTCSPTCVRHYDLMILDTTTFVASYVLDPNGDIKQPIPGGANQGPQGLAVSEGRVYVSQLGAPVSNVLIVDTSSVMGAIIGTIDLPGTANPGIGVDLEGSQVYVSYQLHDAQSGTAGYTEIGIIDTATDSLVGVVDDPERSIVWAKAAVDPYVPLLDSLKCVAGKRKAVGKAAKATLSCHAKAQQKAVAVDSVCLSKADVKLQTTFTKLGTVCPGDIVVVAPLLADCVTTLLDDVPAQGQCAAKSTGALGKAVQGRLTCAAKDAVKPGAFGLCAAKAAAKLSKSLQSVGACAQPDALDDVIASVAGLIDALPR